LKRKEIALTCRVTKIGLVKSRARLKQAGTKASIAAITLKTELLYVL